MPEEKPIEGKLRRFNTRVSSAQKSVLPLVKVMRANPEKTAWQIQKELGIDKPKSLQEKMALALIMHEETFPELHKDRKLSKDLEEEIKRMRIRKDRLKDPEAEKRTFRAHLQDLQKEVLEAGISKKPYSIEQAEKFLNEFEDFLLVVKAHEAAVKKRTQEELKD
jgi:hypothetical protein